ncbi:hypothetical protein KCU98_g12575, partial [Aureobasidium melanogenum]
MASPDHTKPILQSDNDEIKQTLLRGPTAGQQSLLPVPAHRRRPNLPLAQREIIESNFAYQTTTRPSDSWEGMRKLGLSVYADDTTFSWWIRGEAAPVDDNLSISNEVDAVEDEQEDVEEVEVEQEAATPGPLLASPNVSPLADPAASEESRGSRDEHMSDLPQEDTTEAPTVTPEPRLSTRVAQQKLKEEHDQQVKEEPIDPNPRTTQTKRTVTLPRRSKKKSVQSKQQVEQRSRRRSTRFSAKRNFADEPWSTPTNQSN